MKIEFEINHEITSEKLVDVIQQNHSGDIVGSKDLIEGALSDSKLTISAWWQGQLVSKTIFTLLPETQITKDHYRAWALNPD